MVFEQKSSVLSIHKISLFLSEILKSIAEIVNIVVSSVSTTDIVRQSYIGENGVFKIWNKGSIIIDMSTTDAETAINLAIPADELGL
ncbi:NAD(P)-binding domain-containing protein [Viridibacillus sp. NPDC093762]|uniref:NAD(P)-binding domain-containing protein n=1 Tax=Viridibacillus sp. NPDC093762 TaxID=3390720 RepID=UPI003CFDCBC5